MDSFMDQRHHHGSVVFYEAAGIPAVEVRLDRETVWLSLTQMAAVFQRDKSVISRHISAIYKSGELPKAGTVAKNATVQTEGKRQITRGIEFYNLDMIISVGYRVNSKRGVLFRQWATRVLREHLVRGYTVNERRLAELKQTVRLVEAVLDRHAVSGGEAAAMLRVVADFTRALDLLDDYDHQRVAPAAGKTGAAAGISYEEAIGAIARLKEKFAASVHFGVEKDDSLRGSLAAVFQTFGGREMYQTLEAKAASLLYFLVKNHSFVDGNKRIAAALFLWFLEKNGALYRTDGGKRLADATLVAVTLMIAESRPAERETLCRIVEHLLE